jgi:elongation factor 2
LYRYSEALGDCQVAPERGTVCFSAGLHNWAFTLTVFAKMYAVKAGVYMSNLVGPIAR